MRSVLQSNGLQATMKWQEMSEQNKISNVAATKSTDQLFQLSLKSCMKTEAGVIRRKWLER